MKLLKTIQGLARVALSLGLGVAAVLLTQWASRHPWFAAIVSVGFALFVCSLFFLAFLLLRNLLRGHGLIK